jgi:hypothetical protein
MPYVPQGWKPGDPKTGWMRRREFRERLCQRMFGHDQETMFGVVVIAIGGAIGGMVVVATARDGWSFENVVGGIAAVIVIVGFGMIFLPKRPHGDF